MIWLRVFLTDTSASFRCLTAYRGSGVMAVPSPSEVDALPKRVCPYGSKDTLWILETGSPLLAYLLPIVLADYSLPVSRPIAA